ncbi:ornithine carbamoyltransferase [Stackebrandtia albiflava]|uniref:Ornithine carbamoyltransferase n=1 Tax=Stackebrandtia albiflava TaxID=406432 RepID=A0A562VEN3_9ACTN|nr:ornithine carbamoyltransferase [Stackebrandtia albiflava]TWJ16277.1 ornithine carbamoyltransferase [Stackebrandtia albiflava]
MRHFLRDDDLTAGEQRYLIESGKWFKANRYRARPLLAWPTPGAMPRQQLTGADQAVPPAPRSVAVLFEKESTRTRISFQVGIAELGGNPVVIDAQSSQLSRGESIQDTARVLSGYVDGIVIRTFGDERIRALADASGVPVVNALTDGFHPCQLLADLMTVEEEFGRTAGVTIAYVGDAANNMAHSYLLAGALAGAHVRVAGPAAYQPDPTVVDAADRLARTTGGSVTVLTDPVAAVSGADVVATDTWVSMGQHDGAARLSALSEFQVNAELLGHAADHGIVLHCLPAHRGEEITDEVMDGPRSRILTQAENRLHAQKALLAWLLNTDLRALPGMATSPVPADDEVEV